MSDVATTSSVVAPHGPLPDNRRDLTSLGQQGMFLGVVVLMFVSALAFLPAMRDGSYLMIQLSAYSGIAIMALGQTFVVLQVGFDLSTGAVQGFTGGVVYILVGWHWNDLLVIVGALAVSVFIGVVIHGLLIAKLKMNYFIVTLATFTILPSLLRVTLDGSSKSLASPALDSLAYGATFGIRNQVILAAGAFVVLWAVLNLTVFGRNVYAVGSNREAARLVGVRVGLVTVACYGISALCAGIAGLMLVGNLGAADPGAGLGNEFLALTAVLLGGTRFSGGQGSLFGTILGVAFLGLLTNVLLLSEMPQFWIGAVQGVTLLVAVAVDKARREP